MLWPALERAWALSAATTPYASSSRRRLKRRDAFAADAPAGKPTGVQTHDMETSRNNQAISEEARIMYTMVFENNNNPHSQYPRMTSFFKTILPHMFLSEDSEARRRRENEGAHTPRRTLQGDNLLSPSGRRMIADLSPHGSATERIPTGPDTPHDVEYSREDQRLWDEVERFTDDLIVQVPFEATYPKIYKILVSRLQQYRVWKQNHQQVVAHSPIRRRALSSLTG